MPIIYVIILIFILVGLDQWIKALITTHIQLGSITPFIPHIVSLTNLHNSGAAWSMLSGQNLFFEIIALVALVILSYYIWKCRKNFFYCLSLSMILAGTLGNLISRIAQGYVTDMFQLDFINFPVFNISDSCLSLGVMILIIAIIKEK